MFLTATCNFLKIEFVQIEMELKEKGKCFLEQNKVPSAPIYPAIWIDYKKHT